MKEADRIRAGLEPEGDGDDPAIGFRAVLALRRLSERMEAAQVALARGQGWSWQQIGDALGVTRQSVHAKHGR
jgi:DNA-directed RNA polymerase specialized sigma24 family protein